MKKMVLVLAILLLAGCASTAKVADINELPEVIGDHGEGEIAAYLPKVGTSKDNLAPDFTVTDIDGNTIRLADYRGETPVLLFFWTTWCPACIHDLGLIKKYYHAYQDDVVIIAVNMDKNEDEQRVREFVAENPNPGVIWVDSDDLLKTYNVLYTSTKVAIDRKGIILWRGSGEMEESYFVTLLQGFRNA